MKYILVLIVFMFGSCAYGSIPDSLINKQSNSSKKINLITLQNQLDRGFNYWHKPFKGHWSGIYVGCNGLTNEDYSNYSASQQNFLDTKLIRSNILDINLFQLAKGIQRNRNTIGFLTGLGIEFQTFMLDKNTSINKTNNQIEPVTLIYDSDQKSKFSSSYLLIPFLIEFQIPTKHYGNSLYFSTGLTAGIRLASHTKIKYRKNNKKQKLKTPDNFYLRDIRYEATVRLGYRWINLFATYDLRKLFKSDKGPALTRYSFGFALLTF